MKRRIGAHVSIAGGLNRAIDREIEMGANCAQIFTSPPQQWKSVGWQHVSVIHLNDSKVELGKKVDRHQNIGEGCIGLDGFRAFVTHPLIESIPLILEVPGFAQKGPDKVNIDRVHSLFP